MPGTCVAVQQERATTGVTARQTYLFRKVAMGRSEWVTPNLDISHGPSQYQHGDHDQGRSIFPRRLRCIQSPIIIPPFTKTQMSSDAE